MLGFALVGIGCSNVVSVMSTWIGKQHVVPTSAAVPAITTMDYSGILLGPVFIGFLTQRTNLSVAMMVVAIALVSVAVSAPKLRSP